MKMKYFLLPAAMALFCGSQLLADDKEAAKPAEPGKDNKPAECTFVKDQLKLNDEQSKKLKELMDEIKQLREANKKAIDELNVKNEEKTAETLAKARGFISELQFQKLVIMLDRVQSKMRHPGQGMQPGGQGMPQHGMMPGPQGMKPCMQQGAQGGPQGMKPGMQGPQCGPQGMKCCGGMGQKPGPQGDMQCGPQQPGPQPGAQLPPPADKPAADDKK